MVHREIMNKEEKGFRKSEGSSVPIGEQRNRRPKEGIGLVMELLPGHQMQAGKTPAEFFEDDPGLQPGKWCAQAKMISDS